MRPRALKPLHTAKSLATTFAVATVRAVFALTLLLAAGVQAVAVGGHFERDWALHAADGRTVAVHPAPDRAHEHAAEAHVQCAVCRALAMPGREGPATPGTPLPQASALLAGLDIAAATADLPAPILGFRSRAPPA